MYMRVWELAGAYYDDGEGECACDAKKINRAHENSIRFFCTLKMDEEFADTLHRAHVEMKLF